VRYRRGGQSDEGVSTMKSDRTPTIVAVHA
jgi:hypothetical protein